jgi:hypothetical protein
MSLSENGKEGSTSWFYWFLIPDARILWLPFALWRAWREIRQQKIPYLEQLLKRVRGEK